MQLINNDKSIYIYIYIYLFIYFYTHIRSYIYIYLYLCVSHIYLNDPTINIDKYDNDGFMEFIVPHFFFGNWKWMMRIKGMDLGDSIAMGAPIAGWFMMETPIYKCMICWWYHGKCSLIHQWGFHPFRCNLNGCWLMFIGYRSWPKIPIMSSIST